MRSRSINALPIPVKRALRKMGEDIRAARLRRRIPMSIMAERAFISRATLGKVEKGDAGVSLGTYATILFVLGMIDRLADIVSLPNDFTGQSLEDETLPLRIRLPRPSLRKS